MDADPVLVDGILCVMGEVQAWPQKQPIIRERQTACGNTTKASEVQRERDLAEALKLKQFDQIDPTTRRH